MMKQVSHIIKLTCFLLLFMSRTTTAAAQDVTELVMKVKAKLDQVNDYTATGKMKTDVAFIKAPVGSVKVFYRKPNLFRMQRNGGISVLPKGGVSVNMGNMIVSDGFTALDAGTGMVGKNKARIVKLLPAGDNNDVILSTLYIDEANLLILKSVTTTRENGTYEMEMNYGKFASFGLPDKVSFSFNTKDYKLPKGITMEFDDTDAAVKDKMKGKKGRVEITYTAYEINKGIAAAFFK
jgi:outer membrane lipoprotein-sorting protein